MLILSANIVLGLLPQVVDPVENSMGGKTVALGFNLQ